MLAEAVCQTIPHSGVGCSQGVTMDRRIFWILSTTVVLLALVLRDLYVGQAVIWRPFGGDAGQYVRYAQNMALGYFGNGDGPDAYRPPGYPALIALSQMLDGDWYARLLRWQGLIGTATVAMTIALARQWLPAWAAIVSGLLLALWPHHIAFSAEVLSEVLYGFLLTAALLVAAVAKGRAWVWMCAGLLFAAAAMVNTIAVLVPLLAGAALIGRQSLTAWAALLVPVLLIAGGWSLRPVEGGSDRVWQNLVQGSHPLYHRAYTQQLKDPAMAEVNAAIDAETAAMVENPSEGLPFMASRIAASPGRYLSWYVTKPWVQWDWDVRVSGLGGPYVHLVNGSTLEQSPLREVSALMRALNPILFVLATLFALYALTKPGPARTLALVFLYSTAVHAVLQADPRHSVPYRPLQFLLVSSALSALPGYARTIMRTHQPAHGQESVRRTERRTLRRPR